MKEPRLRGRDLEAFARTWGLPWMQSDAKLRARLTELVSDVGWKDRRRC